MIRSVLFVEDRPNTTRNFIGWFRRRGVKVDVAHDYDEAKYQLKAKEYDLLVIDLSFPMSVKNESKIPEGVFLANKLSSESFAGKNYNTIFLFMTNQKQSFKIDALKNTKNFIKVLSKSNIVGSKQEFTRLMEI